MHPSNKLEFEMTMDKLIALAGVSLFLTLVSSWAGDDDVAYGLFNRKPTGAEAIARLRYVLIKFFASLYCGALSALLIAQYLKHTLLFVLPEEGLACLMGLCMALTGLSIGIIQNWIRIFQKRKQRPIFDVALLRYNLGQWNKWFGKTRE